MYVVSTWTGVSLLYAIFPLTVLCLVHIPWLPVRDIHSAQAKALPVRGRQLLGTLLCLLRTLLVFPACRFTGCQITHQYHSCVASLQKQNLHSHITSFIDPVSVWFLCPVHMLASPHGLADCMRVNHAYWQTGPVFLNLYSTAAQRHCCYAPMQHKHCTCLTTDTQGRVCFHPSASSCTNLAQTKRLPGNGQTCFLAAHKLQDPSAEWGSMLLQIVGVIFPVMIIALVPIRQYIMPRFFSRHTLQELDPAEYEEPVPKSQDEAASDAAEKAELVCSCVGGAAGLAVLVYAV